MGMLNAMPTPSGGWEQVSDGDIIGGDPSVFDIRQYALVPLDEVELAIYVLKQHDDVNAYFDLRLPDGMEFYGKEDTTTTPGVKLLEDYATYFVRSGSSDSNAGHYIIWTKNLRYNKQANTVNIYLTDNYPNILLLPLKRQVQ